MVTTALPAAGSYRARLERAIRRRDLAAWAEHVIVGLAIIANPPISVQTALGQGSILQLALGGFFIAGGLVGFIVRARGRYRYEKIAVTLTWFGLAMYLVVLVFASRTGYPSGVGLIIVVLLLTYLDKQRLERKIFEHAARPERPSID